MTILSKSSECTRRSKNSREQLEKSFFDVFKNYRERKMVKGFAFSKRLVAVCGKGGTGKTVLAALMTKVLLEHNKADKLLLIDADPAMGLCSALGVKVRRTMGQVREEIIKTARKGKDESKQLLEMLDYLILEALTETEKFALIAMGRTETLGCFCPVNNLLREAIGSLSQNFDTLIIDGEAGLEQINRQVMQHVDTLVIVSDATSRGVDTARAIKGMVENERIIQCERVGLVFNRVQGNEEILKELAERLRLPVFGFVPQDNEIAYYDLIGKPIIELASSAGLDAVRHIAQEHLFRERFSSL